MSSDDVMPGGFGRGPLFGNAVVLQMQFNTEAQSPQSMELARIALQDPLSDLCVSVLKFVTQCMASDHLPRTRSNAHEPQATVANEINAL
jgi:hypothetical protein